MRKTGIKGYAYNFFVDYNIVNVINIHKYLMKKHDIT